MRNKKSQVTVYIIIGIIILFISAGIIYLRNISIEKSETEVPTIHTVPIEFSPVKEYVTNCVEQTAVKGLKLLGLQGGYIYPEQNGITVNEFSPTSSTGIKYAKTVPYWYYMDSPNTCQTCSFRKNIPPLYRNNPNYPSNQITGIEAQLDQYIKNNLKTCLDNFRDFNEQGFTIVEKGSIEPRTIIAENDIKFYVEYPLEVTKGNSKKEIFQYLSTITLNFKEIYSLAIELTDTITDSKFLEFQLLQIISGFQGLNGGTNENNLPPLASTRFERGNFEYWIKTDVKEDLQSYLSSYLGISTIQDSLNFEGNPYAGNNVLASSMYSQMILSLNTTYPDLNIYLEYLPIWPIYLEVTPSEGDLISPITFSSPFVSWLGIQQYEFAYDVSYPALIEINEPNVPSSFGDDYSFYFALEANVRNNEPLTPSTLQISAYPSTPTYACSANQMNSGVINIDVIDARTNEPVNDASINFLECPVGLTDNGNFEGNMPVGIGTLSVIHPDYYNNVRPFGTVLDRENIVEVYLEPYREKKIKVMRMNLIKNLFNGQWEFDFNPVDLQPDDQLSLTFELIPGSAGEPHSAFAAFNGAEEKYVSLIPGKYQVQATLVSKVNNAVVIKKQKKCVGFWPFKTCSTIPEIQLLDPGEVFMSGGLSFDEDNYLEIRAEDLDNSQEIIFYTIAYNPEQFTSLDDLKQTSKIEEYSLRYKHNLKPTYVR